MNMSSRRLRLRTFCRRPEFIGVKDDGNAYSYAYGSLFSNGVLLVTNFYDAKSRRVRKVTSEATTTFFYDDWNLVEERVAYTNGTISTIHYYWGKDLSGTFQGAGGIGGLLYLTVDGAVYNPCYDNNGNITRYVDASETIVADYDAFGRAISQSGTLADVFHHRFSSKCFDVETGFYYYGRRFYSPVLRRWLNRDPIGERGGINLYGVCKNNVVSSLDPVGRDIWVETTPAVMGFHQRVCVTRWSPVDEGGKCCKGIRYERGGKYCISFGMDGNGDGTDSFSGDGGSSDSDGSGNASVSGDESLGSRWEPPVPAISLQDLMVRIPKAMGKSIRTIKIWRLREIIFSRQVMIPVPIWK